MTQRHVLFEADGLPTFQHRIYDSPDAALACRKGDMRLVQDLNSGLIYNESFDPDLMVYDSNYNNEQSLSASFQKHMDSVIGLLKSKFSRSGLVEIGCGKGHFFAQLLDAGFDVTGYDPTYEGDSPRIKKEYFTKDSGIRAEGIVLRHVLEHIPDPVGFLQTIRDANGGGGLIYIEVPCFDWICENKTWFDIFYEHVNYFRISDFKRMFGRILHVERTFGDQYISLIADLSTLTVPTWTPDCAVDFPSDFFTLTPNALPADMVIWGAGSKGVLYALHMARLNVRPSVVVDINPAKQGKYLPATGIEIVSPATMIERAPADTTILIMNSNYHDEIRAQTENRFAYVLAEGL